MRSIWQNEEFLGSEKKKFHHNKISLFFYLELYKKKKNTIKSRQDIGCWNTIGFKFFTKLQRYLVGIW